MNVYSYDRRENDVVILVDEAGESVAVSVSVLPADAQAGDRLVQTETGYAKDLQSTADVRRRIRELQSRLRRQ